MASIFQRRPIERMILVYLCAFFLPNFLHAEGYSLMPPNDTDPSPISPLWSLEQSDREHDIECSAVYLVASQHILHASKDQKDQFKSNSVSLLIAAAGGEKANDEQKTLAKKEVHDFKDQIRFWMGLREGPSSEWSQALIRNGIRDCMR